MSKSLKPYAAVCSAGDVFRDDGGRLFLFSKSVRHTEDQSEFVLLCDLSSKTPRDVAYPLDLFRSQLTFTSRIQREFDLPGKTIAGHQSGTIFRHTDGGIYCFDRSAEDFKTGEEMVIYDHLWPFEQSTWARPAQEFLKKFTTMTSSELNVALAGDRAADQARITASRLSRKGAATAPSPSAA